MQRLAAQVPRPRLPLIRFHGVLAPNAKLRSRVVPVAEQTTPAGADDCKHAHSAPLRMTWARLLKRVFDIDVERCACGGKLKIIAVIEEPAVTARILTHLGLAAQPPPRAPARRVDLFQAAYVVNSHWYLPGLAGSLGSRNRLMRSKNQRVGSEILVGPGENSDRLFAHRGIDCWLVKNGV